MPLALAPPKSWKVVALILALGLLALAVLTVIPARASSRRSVADVLQSESA